jgi:seryl-tRNA synthetase
VDAFRALEGERKTLQTRTEELQSQRNSLSKQIGMLKGKGQHAEADAVMAQVGAIKDELDASAQRLEVIQAELQTCCWPCPICRTNRSLWARAKKNNIEVRRWGTVPTFDFELKDHVDIGAPLGP